MGKSYTQGTHTHIYPWQRSRTATMATTFLANSFLFWELWLSFCKPSMQAYTHISSPTHTTQSCTHTLTHIQQHNTRYAVPHTSSSIIYTAVPPCSPAHTHTHPAVQHTPSLQMHTWAGRECGVCAHFPSVCPWVSRWKKTMLRHREGQCGRGQPTLKTSLALLCGCLHTTKVSIRQSARITPRMDSDQVWNPPWTATTLKTNTRTPGGRDGVRQSTSSGSHVHLSRTDSSPSTQVHTLTTDPD